MPCLQYGFVGIADLSLGPPLKQIEIAHYVEAFTDLNNNHLRTLFIAALWYMWPYVAYRIP